jgi:hypothetical protein
MAYGPISKINHQYEDFANNWLKGFEQGTTTPLSMATDAAAGTLLAKAEINTQGFIKTAGGALFIPYFNQPYDLWLFPTEAEADANDTTNAIQMADNIDSSVSSGATLVTFNTVALMVASTDLNVGDIVETAGYNTKGDGGDNRYEVVAAATGTDDGGSFIDLATHQAKGLFPGDEVKIKQFGLLGDASDETTAFNAFKDYVAGNSLRGFINKGTYGVNNAITIASNTHFSGEDRNTTTIKLVVDAGTRLFVGDTVSNITIEGLTLDTQKGVFATLRTTIDFNSTNAGSNIIVRDCKIPGSTSGGIVIDRTTGVRIEGNDIRDCVEGDCVRASNGFDIQVTNNYFSTLTALVSTRRVIQIGTSQNFIVKGNVVRDATLTYVYDFGGSAHGVLTGDVNTNCRSIIDMEGQCNNITITGNTFSGKGTGVGNEFGITVLENPSGSTANSITIAGNALANYFHGVRVEGGREIMISGNTVDEMFGHGISIVQGAVSGKVSDNINITGNVVHNVGKATPATYTGIAGKFDRGLISGNSIRSSQALHDILTDAANTVVSVHGNFTNGAVTRAETSYFTELSVQRIFETASNPEGFITANPGDLCLRSTGGAATTLYVKESGSATNTGWIGK